MWRCMDPVTPIVSRHGRAARWWGPLWDFLGAAFFGESMFAKTGDASRAAFAALCEWCWSLGFHFIDGQVPNENLEKLGARVMDRGNSWPGCAVALELPTRQGSWKAG